MSLSTAQLFLQKNGTFLVKFFQFGDTASAYNRIESRFEVVQRLKPKSSRSESSEFYVLAQRKKSSDSGVLD